MDALILSLVAQYPVLASVLLVMGGLRIVVKPLMGILHELAIYTPTQKDDELLGKVEASSFYKGLVYVVDWFASVKLPGAQ